MSPSPLVKEEALPPFTLSDMPPPSVVSDLKTEEQMMPSPITHTLSLPHRPRSRSPSASGSQPPTPQESSASTPSASTSSRSPDPTASTSTPRPPPAKGARKGKAKVEDSKPIMMDHLPTADDEAAKEFVKMTTNHHQFNTLGRSHQDEDAMVCDCSFRPGTDEAQYACGEGSGCINRLTQVECLESECRSREHCQNQRFTRKQYANIEVIKTERKGYGLRAAEEIENDAFIYEYIGEVVQQSTFMKRMREYAASGIRHFYFMMLQKDEFLDATKKGGIGRFANHSCNPNCYVAKWVVGKRMRMGIFAKRDIIKGEELTFNYNVDRYGHDAQPCYCDEPNCVGSIGGKTQTDIGGMDDLYLDALGIADEVEELGLKGNRRRKGKKLGEDFMPILKPVEEVEVPKLIAAIRQATSNRPMLTKLLSRVKMTTDEAVQRQVMRMHGFNLMGNVLRDFGDDKDVVKLSLETMSAWPMQARNKIIDSKIEDAIQRAVEPDGSDEIKEAAQALLDAWSKLPVNYRIAKKPVRIPDAGDDKELGDGASPGTPTVPIPPTPTHEYSSNPFVPSSNSASTPSGPAFSMPTPTRLDPSRVHSMSHGPPAPVAAESPSTPQPAPSQVSAGLTKYLAQLKADRDAKEKERIAAEAVAAARASVSASSSASGAGGGEGKKRKKSSLGGSRSGAASASSVASTSANGSGSALESQKEKRLTKQVGEVVVRSMSKYKDQIGDSDRFKRYAKECTDLIVRKEKQSSTYRSLTAPPPPLSEEKQAKMKKFTKDFAHRLIKKILARSKSTRHGGSSSTGTNGTPNGEASTSTAATTPNDLDGPSMDLDGEELEEYGAGDESMMAEEEVDGEENGVEDAPMAGEDGPSGSVMTAGSGAVYGGGTWGDEEADEDGRRGLKDARLSTPSSPRATGTERVYFR